MLRPPPACRWSPTGRGWLAPLHLPHVAHAAQVILAQVQHHAYSNNTRYSRPFHALHGFLQPDGHSAVLPCLTQETATCSARAVLPGRAQARRSEQVGIPVLAGIGSEPEDRLAHLLRGEHRAGRRQVGVNLDALPGSVAGHRGRA